MAVVIHGRMTIRPEMLEETRSAAIQVGEASRADPGCNEYLFTQDLVDPAVLILAEEWRQQKPCRRTWQRRASHRSPSCLHG